MVLSAMMKAEMSDLILGKIPSTAFWRLAVGEVGVLRAFYLFILA